MRQIFANRNRICMLRDGAARELNFTWNGRRLNGLEGDTLASALLANGIDVVGRSFKYSRRRGITGHGAEEPNAIIQIGSGARTIPNVKATQIELYDGLEASSVSGWPSLHFDFMGIADWFSRMMPPGFYYKTFMYPAKFWMNYEYFIRRAAGLGKCPVASDPDIYDKLNQHADVLIIGGGPAGLMAAREAALTGARVIITDEQPNLGGSLLGSTKKIAGQHGRVWLRRMIDELTVLDNLMILTKSTAFGLYDHNFVCISQELSCGQIESSSLMPRQRLHRVRAKQIIFATGAFERPLVFARNDLPGIMQASSVSTYVNRYGVAPGNDLVLFVTNDNAYSTALDWHEVGRRVVAVIDTRFEPDKAVVDSVRSRGITVLTGHVVMEARGKRRVKRVLVAPINADGTEISGAVRYFDCDLVAVSGGWSPAIHLSSHIGSKPIWDETIVGFKPSHKTKDQRSVGSCNGTFSLGGCLAEGARAGAHAANKTGFGNGQPRHMATPLEESKGHQQAIFLVPHTLPTTRAPYQFVDMQLDVTASSIQIAAREGFESIEHVKRYTALGFGTDQGKLGNVNGMAILADTLGQTISQTGTSMFRPAYTPTSFGVIAGRDVGSLFDPERHTAIHSWHCAEGAEFENVGQWKRPWYYPRFGKDGHKESLREAVDRECLAVRNGVGILDASTLGKIDIQGPDAAEFLERVYTNSFNKLQPGRCRYGLMLKEDGMIFDDGVCACIGKNHYLMYTTTGGAAAVLEWLELWQQTEWPELTVYFTSVTDHWSTSTISGPDARRVLGKVCKDVEIDKRNFEFMAWRSGTVAGIDARIFRISFTGELSFEINVPSQYGLHVWMSLIEAGEEFGITPYGTESMHALRAEKGFVIVGQDTDGSMTPSDMNMNWIVAKNKEFSFIGERSLARSDSIRDDRKQLVGLRPVNKSEVLPEGSQVVFDPDESIPMSMQGHVTSSYFSSNLGFGFALAVIKGGQKRFGEIVYCPRPDGQVIAAEIVDSIFYDKGGERQNV